MNEGDHVNIKVSAINYYGESPYSSVGDGASIWLIPDEPVSLANDALVTDASVIGLTWSAGVSNGGTPVLDYTIYYAHVDDDYTLLESGVTTLSYSTIVSLITNE
jgi:hypothetical protein